MGVIMTPEERYKITSNEFVDLIIDYNESPAILAQYQNFSVHIMNPAIAVIYVPSTEITARSIGAYGYSAFPTLYGLESIQSLEASGIVRLRNIPVLNLRGQGVLVGIIDTGIDYTNPVFRRADGTSKIVSLWDQTIDSENRYPSTPFPYVTFYGTEYTQEDINLALNSANPYEIVPSFDEIGHGTMLAGVAAGNEMRENNFAGVAPDADLVVVKLKQAKPVLRNHIGIPLDVPCYQENDVMWGVQYLIAVARVLRRPIAICIGLGTSQGPHNGRDFLSVLLTTAADFRDVAISIAAGNEGNNRRHYFGAINRDIGYDTVELNVGEGQSDFWMELWGNPPGTYSVDVLSPFGEYIPRIVESIRINREISFVFEPTVIFIDYIVSERLTGEQLIFFRFRNPTPGIWRFRVYGRGNLQENFHIWLPSGEFISPETYFTESNPYTTITAPGYAMVPITTTAYNSETGALYLPSGKGFSRDEAIKPDLAAPGVNIVSPTINNTFVLASGTSIAAAHMTGITAMLLEWGSVRGNLPGIDTVQIKKFLLRGANRNPNLPYPNRNWGYGIVDIFNVFNVLRSDF